MATDSTHNQSTQIGTAHRGTAVEYHFEWTTSECVDTGNLIDELHITSNEDATISHRYCTYLQDHSSQHARRIIHSTDRFVASATASCESLAQLDTKSEQYALAKSCGIPRSDAYCSIVDLDEMSF